ncbi:DUF2254 domain-containing protein [Altererythrobacter aurantiacus]|uniref:DUF2254 domain-containing protein n=1 Tax=Parapontixanthobacter aurantiacus TaxID=1463599 RepID=A0A844ZBG7_9SPHN|nr:DUF2254 family protein [Parapontixanthobacter aurantiacus]MXO84536.1 DUF2254 domain-containing protein [Parapontixanthobacter aurantiacus]
MMEGGPVKGLFGWVLHRLTASYWSVPLAATIIALPASWAALTIDREGFGADIYADNLALVPVAGAAQEFASVVAGVNAALLTLYFSITLLVLTIATANLGVRLIDRWLDKRLTRISLGGLSFNLIFSLVVLAAIDPDAAAADIPHGTLWALILLETVNVAMLAVALHDLGRTIFVDRSIAHIARDAGRDRPAIVVADPFQGHFADRIAAPRSGYVEGIDLDRLASDLATHPGRIRFCAPPGRHVMAGEPLALLENGGADHETVCRSIPIGQFRSGGQGAVFDIRLLVEIAARALSPAVNDFYTALACADRMADAMVAHETLWVSEEKVAAYEKAPRFELPGQDFRGFYDYPLKGFRQAASAYPSVTIRMIDNFGRVARQVNNAELVAFLEEQAREWARHAIEKGAFEGDAKDIREALNGFLERREKDTEE